MRPKCRQRAAERAAKSSAGSRFVRLRLGRLRPATFPRLRGQCQKPGLRGHHRLPGSSRAGSRGREVGGGGFPVPSRVNQHDEAGGGARLGSPEHPGRAGQIPEAVGPGAHGEKRKEAGHRGDGLRTVGEGRAQRGRFDAPLPSEKRACCSVCSSRRRQSFPGPRRNSGLVGANNGPWHPNSSRHRKPRRRGLLCSQVDRLRLRRGAVGVPAA